MLHLLGTLIFWLGRWKVSGEVPALEKYVIIIAPHTSNWDFVIAAAAKFKLRIKARFLAKAELFHPLYGWFFRILGGYPVDRSQHTNLVDSVIDLFNSQEEFSIGLSPEGTRRYTPKWKTGFYHIADQAGCPIIMVGLDYSTRSLHISKPFHPTGDISADFPKLHAFFLNFKARYPAQTGGLL